MPGQECERSRVGNCIRLIFLATRFYSPISLFHDMTIILAVDRHYVFRVSSSSSSSSSGVLLGLPTLLHFFLSLGMAIASLMFACVAMSFSQVVIGLPLGLVPCTRPIIRSSVMPYFLTRRPWKASRLLRSPSRRVGFVLALLKPPHW